MANMRDKASESYEDKMERMGLGSGGRGTKIRTAAMGEDEGKGHALPDNDGTQGENSGSRATGYASEAENEEMVAEKRGKPRLDRPAYKRGGRVGKHKGVSVNVIVAPQNAPKVAMPPAGGLGAPPPMPPQVAPPPPSMPGGPMGGLPGAGAMPRKRGGRVPVPMNAGSGGGLGRLEKVKDYGSRAKPGGKAGAF